MSFISLIKINSGDLSEIVHAKQIKLELPSVIGRGPLLKVRKIHEITNFKTKFQIYKIPVIQGDILKEKL